METINAILDIVLIAASIFMVISVRGIGGIWGKAFGFLAWGAIVLGLAHLIETITFSMLKLPTDMVEFIHRLIILLGFVLLTVGFRQIAKTK